MRNNTSSVTPAKIKIIILFVPIIPNSLKGRENKALSAKKMVAEPALRTKKRVNETKNATATRHKIKNSCVSKNVVVLKEMRANMPEKSIIKRESIKVNFLKLSIAII
jgi:hypothetical protein